jgi:hypothetical protein
VYLFFLEGFCTLVAQRMRSSNKTRDVLPLTAEGRTAAHQLPSCCRTPPSRGCSRPSRHHCQLVYCFPSNYNSTCRPCRVCVCARGCASARVGVVACVVCPVLVLGNMGMGIPSCCKYEWQFAASGCVAGVPRPSATCVSYVGLRLRSVNPAGSPSRERGAGCGPAMLAQ